MISLSSKNESTNTSRRCVITHVKILIALVFIIIISICFIFHVSNINFSPIRSINKRDSRGAFLYVVSKFSDDFHIFFSSEAQCERYVLYCTVDMRVRQVHIIGV